jgi:hypothetical protein
MLLDVETRITLNCDSSIHAAGCLPGEGKAIDPSLTQSETPISLPTLQSCVGGINKN